MTPYEEYQKLKQIKGIDAPWPEPKKRELNKTSFDSYLSSPEFKTAVFDRLKNERRDWWDALAEFRQAVAHHFGVDESDFDSLINEYDGFLDDEMQVIADDLIIAIEYEDEFRQEQEKDPLLPDTVSWQSEGF